MVQERGKQLAYSEAQALMLDENHRRTKARKIVAVLRHFTGRERFDDLVVADVGCSAGFISDELRALGARVFGVDIDVPGLAKAQAQFGSEICFLCADGEALPWPDDSVDLIVFNHIYEHVVDPDAVVRELQRVLKPGGAMYLGLGNRLGVMEPHYRLPFLSWLPHGRLADAYVRRFNRADRYHERFRTRPGLRQLTRGLTVWDYTYAVIADPVAFSATEMVKGPLAKVPVRAFRLARPLIPTFVWVATKDGHGPAGRELAVAPERVAT